MREYDSEEPDEPVLKASLGQTVLSGEQGNGGPGFVAISIGLAGILLGGMALFLNLNNSGNIEDTAKTAILDVANEVETLRADNESLRAELASLRSSLESQTSQMRTLARDTQRALDTVGAEVKRNRDALTETDKELAVLLEGINDTRNRMASFSEPRVTQVYNPHAPAPVAPQPEPSPSGILSNGNRIHVVQPGDTFSSLSQKYNVSISSIQSANPTIDPTRMKIGAEIRIPPKETN